MTNPIGRALFQIAQVARNTVEKNLPKVENPQVRNTAQTAVDTFDRFQKPLMDLSGGNISSAAVGAMAEVARSLVPQPPATTGVVMTTSASANVRAEATTGSDKLTPTALPEGTQVLVTGPAQPGEMVDDLGDQWVPVTIQLPGQEPQAGFINEGLLNPLPEGQQPLPGRLNPDGTVSTAPTLTEDGLPTPEHVGARTPPYLQGDSQWANLPLNNNQTPLTQTDENGNVSPLLNADGTPAYANDIGAVGCLITSSAMSMSNTLQAYGYPPVTPADLDARVDQVNGYNEYSGLATTEQANAGAVPLEVRQNVMDTGLIDEALDVGLTVTMEVRVGQTEDNPGSMHFVTITGRTENEDGSVSYTALDPGYRTGDQAREISFSVDAEGQLHSEFPKNPADENSAVVTYDTAPRVEGGDRGTGMRVYWPTQEMIDNARAASEG
ncbi:hypothetical protein [Archangium violaceum]|uniref:Uncharacterized protein n=1 Tax=Archangium violaceum Cb vi76 TaxID=1406225 RepID=A0A084SJ54_9BACT|nr:hypothetical protein [Archangium violaceum]KFA88489.1 hypothetical protein Q664_41490 [Archangium violaceum Cb vi76]